MMDEHVVAAVAGETRPASSEARTADTMSGAQPIDDPRALTILTTEHWSLLTARSLVYNEAFARSGMFLAFLSATLLVLGLLSAATGFTDTFLLITALVLALDLFIGLATLGRIGSTTTEDLRYLQGMNRLRHAYHEMVPGLERYFITSSHDDFASIAAFYRPRAPTGIWQLLHGLTTTPGMISAICSALAGGLAGVVALLVARDGGIAGLVASLVLVAVFVVLSRALRRNALGFAASLDVMFPAPPRAAADPSPDQAGADRRDS
jgi:hypothetical protein